MKKIAVLTSGGDAPGMNAAIRAVTRFALAQGAETVGVRQGYAGLVRGDFIPLSARRVGGIIQRGGTILGSARCQEFRTEAGVARAVEGLCAQSIEGLVVIGGNGTQAGARDLAARGFPVVGVASTIDNDLVGSDTTVGVDTALNIALESIDRLKVTAASHQRAFLIEVMGRDCGYLAMVAGLAGGVDAIVIPELEDEPEEVAQKLRAAYERGKTHALAVVAEGARNNAGRLEDYFRQHRDRLNFELRVTKLGHVQRGGTPTAYDRLLATRLGVGATERLLRGEHGVLVGWIAAAIAATPLQEVAGAKKTLDLSPLHLARILAR